jgi:hypothetical protein
MKYLKSYKMFEFLKFNDENEIYIKDIFQELIDKDFIVDINENKKFINIIILRENRNFFKYPDVSDYIISCIEYMKSVGYDNIETTYYNCWNNLVNLDIDKNNNRLEIRQIEIYFNKDEESKDI